MTPSPTTTSNSVLLFLFKYKAWANEELFSLMRTIDASLHQDALHAATRILNHAYVVDCIFKAHLSRVAHGLAATNTPQTPSIEALAALVMEVDAWYVDYVTTIRPASLHEVIPFAFTDGDAGSMSREEILLHVVTHGGYHRGQAGQVLRAASVAPPRDLYTRFLHMIEPARRTRPGTE